MKLIKSSPYAQVYHDDDKIVKKYGFHHGKHLIEAKFALYFDDFNSKYNMFPEIYDVYEEEELIVCEMEKIEGDTLQNNMVKAMHNQEIRDMRVKVMEWVKQTHDLVGCFLDYNTELIKTGKVFIHEDIHMSNIVVDSSGKLKMIDLDALRVYPAKKYSPYIYYARWIAEFHNHTIHLE